MKKYKVQTDQKMNKEIKLVLKSHQSQEHDGFKIEKERTLPKCLQDNASIILILKPEKHTMGQYP
jgi:hypothetical protein